MTTEEDQRFGAVAHPQGFEELLSLITGATDAPAPVRMWRGQADQSWLLHSSGYRRVAKDRPDATEQNLAYYERQLLRRATHAGYRHVDGRTLSDFELLARLQHHGAATRLLDTTRNAMVGVYFACATQPEKDGLLFGIHTTASEAVNTMLWMTITNQE